MPTKSGPLGIWVMNQRHYYRLLKEGKSSRMIDDRIQKLESIGSQWSLRCSQLKNRETVQWDAQFQEMKKYKEINGHCNVPTRSGSLGIWVNTQRHNYWLSKEGKSSRMSDDRIQKLESIGFQWSLRCGLSKDEKTVQWDAQFQKLKKYKEMHGHCNVPTKSGRLGRWVNRQRYYCRLLKEGKSSRMSDDRIQKLELIGLQWSLRCSQLKNGEIGQWDAQFQGLMKYKETHGHCNVTQRHGRLGKSVNKQRHNYRLLKEGTSAPTSNDRIQKLESIGFQWSCNQQ